MGVERLRRLLGEIWLGVEPEKWSKRVIVVSYLEGLGVFVKRGFMDPRLVDDLMSSYIVTYWQKFGPVTKEMRRRLNDPTAAEHIEYLYDVVYEIYMQQHPELKLQ